MTHEEFLLNVVAPKFENTTSTSRNFDTPESLRVKEIAALLSRLAPERKG
jgi:hypothetical protein